MILEPFPGGLQQPGQPFARCPVCGIEDAVIRVRLAEMPATTDGVRAFHAIGKTYIHPRSRMCDVSTADVVERMGSK